MRFLLYIYIHRYKYACLFYPACLSHSSSQYLVLVVAFVVVLVVVVLVLGN